MTTNEGYSGADCNNIVDPSLPNADEIRRISGVIALANEIEGEGNPGRVASLKEYIGRYTKRPQVTVRTYPEDHSFTD